MKLRTFLFSIIFVICGCSHFAILRQPTVHAGETKTHKIHAFAFGLVSPAGLPPADQLCPEGQVNRIELAAQPLDMLLSIFSLGLYTPHSAKVECSKIKPVI